MRLNLACLLYPALTACVSQLPAAVFKQAEVTRVLNDVRVLPDQASPAAARIGDVINGKTAVATGAQSRAELRFPDKTLTRLGANTLFRLEEGTRDIDLEKGVLLLQVPKQLGGAQVRTAAVTAAVTGTTILVEYQPDGYIKVIVIEGEVDLFMRDSPSTFINLKAGDMILMKADAKDFPLPVKVDLERLMATSKLLNADEFGPIGNDKQIAAALNDQDEKKKDGELMKTAFMLPGRGTRVSLTNEVRREILRFENGGSGGGGGSTVTTTDPGPGTTGTGPIADEPRAPIIRPYNPGTTIITDQDPIATNPSLTAYNSQADDRVTAFGFFYNPQVDGPYGRVIFNQAGTPEINSLVREAGLWAAFHFEDLIINGNPIVNSVNGARNLLLASGAGIMLQGYNYYYEESESLEQSGPPAGSGGFTLDSSLDSVLLASNQGSIVVDATFYLEAMGGQSIIFQTFGAEADIVFNGYFGEAPVQINAPDGRFQAAAGRDVVLSGAGIQADEVSLQAKRDVIIEQGSFVRANAKVSINAAREIQVRSSSEILSLTEGGLEEMVLQAGGNLSVIDAYLGADLVTLESQTANLNFTNATISGDVIRARSQAASGQLIIDGASFNAGSLLRLYADGSNGHIQFVSNSSLSGSRVDIAARTVTIHSGVDVEVSNPSGLRVFTQTPNFNRPSSPNTNGRFTNGGDTLDVIPQAFGNRPAFNAP